MTFERQSTRDRGPATHVGTASGATPSSPFHPDGIFEMQRSAGNAAVTALLTKPAIQRATSAEEVAAGSAAMSVMPPAARPVLARGASGQAVAILQAALAAAMAMPLVADGEYGLQTAALVCLLQRSLGLKVDGMVGPETWLSLDVMTDPLLDEGLAETSGEEASGAASPSSDGAPTTQPAVQREEADETSVESRATSLRAGSAGPDVAIIQTGLTMAYPGAGVVIDGRFGVQTLAFVLLYQVDHGLTPDGIVGPETRKHLDPVESMTRKVAAMEELASFSQDMSDIDNRLDLRAIPPAIIRDMKTLTEKDF